MHSYICMKEHFFQLFTTNKDESDSVVFAEAQSQTSKINKKKF